MFVHVSANSVSLSPSATQKVRAPYENSLKSQKMPMSLELKVLTCVCTVHYMTAAAIRMIFENDKG